MIEVLWSSYYVVVPYNLVLIDCLAVVVMVDSAMMFETIRVDLPT